MKNLILTGLVFATAISLSFAQLKVVAPFGHVNLGDVSNISSANLQEKLNVEGVIQATGKFKGGIGETGNTNIELSYAVSDVAASFGVSKNANNEIVTSFAHQAAGPFTLRTFKPNASIAFITANAAGAPVRRLVITNDGKMGINTSSPVGIFHVNGGAFKPGGGQWSNASDKRLKENIESYDKGLDAVLKLNPISYNYNGKGGIEDTKTTHVGLIAQEYQKVAPDAVSTFEYQNVDMIDNESGAVAFKNNGPVEEYLKIDGSQITYMLVNAIKEQQKIIESLQEEVKNIKGGNLQSTSNSLSVLIDGTNSEKALLAQNTPNPFSSNTSIEYFIPTTAKTAVMVFTDITGKEIKTININDNGVGSLDVSIKEMPIGIYSYSLLVDGQSIATKKMVLSR